MPASKKKKLSASGDSWSALITGRAPLERLYGFDPMQRIAMVKEGAPSAFVPFLATNMAIAKDRIYRIAGVARATIDRKIRAGLRLDPDESERMMAIAMLIGQAQTIVNESGDPTNFDAGKWIAAWLDIPNRALGGARPATFLDTAEGRELVSDLLSRMQSGAYS